MPHIVEIADLSALELDVFVRLTEVRLRSYRAPERALFITESPGIIGYALNAGYEPISLLMGCRQLGDPTRGILTRCGDVSLYTVGWDTLAALVGYELTRGVLCAMRRPSLPAVEELCTGARWMAVLGGIVDPTNIGAIFRSTAALHMNGVLVTPICCDPLHRRTMQASMGTVFQIPWAYIRARSADWPQSELACLRALSLQTAAMALSLEALSIKNSRLVFAEKLAIVPGTEGGGLSPQTMTRCSYTVYIPMARSVDSLNVVVASTMAFWQLGRYK